MSNPDGNRRAYRELRRELAAFNVPPVLYRERMAGIRAMCNRLDAAGFRGMRMRSLGQRHVEALVADWKARGLSPGRMKNLMSHLRWWAETAGKWGMLHSDNARYGIEERRRPEGDRSEALDGRLARIADPYTRLSLELQWEFGLRRQEAIKFMPSYADRGDRVVLKASWCKGGRARWVPVRTAAQRSVLERAHGLAGGGALIPPGRNYVQQMRRFARLTAAAGLGRSHGLRHAYGQRRFEEIAGFAPPAKGGPTWRELSGAERVRDEQARRTVSMELGHGRLEVTSVYLGR